MKEAQHHKSKGIRDDLMLTTGVAKAGNNLFQVLKQNQKSEVLKRIITYKPNCLNTGLCSFSS